MEKQCIKCRSTVLYDSSYKNKNSTYYYMLIGKRVMVGNTCIKCLLKNQADRRNNSRNLESKKYEKTPSGLIMRTYRNMKSRVTGIQLKKAHLYEGLYLLGKEEFYKFCYSDRQFFSIYNTWVESGYERKLSPSIDRIDSSIGYTMDNIRWITHSENSSLGAISKNEKRLSKRNKTRP